MLLTKSNMNNMVYNLSKQGEKVIESETFRALNYVLKDGQITLISENHGIFTFKLECFEDLISEIKEIIEAWKDVKTKKCYVTDKRL